MLRLGGKDIDLNHTKKPKADKRTTAPCPSSSWEHSWASFSFLHIKHLLLDLLLAELISTRDTSALSFDPLRFLFLLIREEVRLLSRVPSVSTLKDSPTVTHSSAAIGCHCRHHTALYLDFSLFRACLLETARERDRSFCTAADYRNYASMCRTVASSGRFLCLEVSARSLHRDACRVVGHYGRGGFLCFFLPSLVFY